MSNCKDCQFFLQDYSGVVCNAFHYITPNNLREANDCVDFEPLEKPQNKQPLESVFSPRERVLLENSHYPEINSETYFYSIISGTIKENTNNFDPPVNDHFGIRNQSRRQETNFILENFYIDCQTTFNIEPHSRVKHIHGRLETEDSIVLLVLKIIFPYYYYFIALDHSIEIDIQGIKGNANIYNINSSLVYNSPQQFSRPSYLLYTIQAYGSVNGFEYDNTNRLIILI